MFAGIATIDGPPASGKTTMASLLAKEYALTHLDSGSIFRTLTLHYMNNGIDMTDIKSVITGLQYANIHMSGEEIFLDGKNVSTEIRSVTVTNNVCHISYVPEIREYVKDLQLSLASSGKVVCDGRKVALEVFPHADVKFYLTADQKTRALRRFYQYQKSDPHIKFEDVYADLKRREESEINNGVLKMHPNAIVIDNTNLSIEETFEKMEFFLN